MDNWCTIESDPGVFSEQIEKIGCKGISVEEIYSLEDKYMLEKMMPIYGLIFQFKWTKNPEPRECLQFYDEDLFFANQMINNACATQALLSCLMNIQDLEMSQEQVEFKQFCKVIDSQSRGLAIGESELLRNVHNSFAKPEPFVYSEKRKAKDDDDVFHFISYIPFKGKVYELDGLQEGPVLLGEIGDDNNWLDIAAAEVNKRIQHYSSNEIRFALQAVIKSKKSIALVEIDRIKGSMNSYKKKLKELQGDRWDSNTFGDVIEGGSADMDLEINLGEGELLDQQTGLKAELTEHELILEEEELKFSKYEKENARRKHNYIPFILEMLKIAAEKGDLQKLYDEAKNKQQAQAQGDKK